VLIDEGKANKTTSVGLNQVDDMLVEFERSSTQDDSNAIHRIDELAVSSKALEQELTWTVRNKS
jgi:hypothetical protein